MVVDYVAGIAVGAPAWFSKPSLMVQLELNRVSFYRPGPPVGLTAGMVLVQHKGLKFKLKFFFTLRVGVVVWSRFDVPPGQKRRYGVMGIRGRAGAKGMPVWVTKILLTA